MSDTPRTDALNAGMLSAERFSAYRRMRAEARDLERELAATERRLAEAEEALRFIASMQTSDIDSAFMQSVLRARAFLSRSKEQT